MITMTLHGRPAVAAVLIFAMAIASCERPGGIGTKKEFDLKGFIDNEARRLTSGHTGLQKAVTANGKTEVLDIEAPDWARELQPFAECDINKPAWAGSFDADTSRPGGNLLRVIYRARERAVKISRLELVWKEGILMEVTAARETSNPYFSSETILRYLPDSGYTIDNRRKVILMNEDRVKITAGFISPRTL